MFATNGGKVVVKVVYKCQRHPSTLAIKERYKDLNFSFSNFIYLRKRIKNFRLQAVSTWNGHTYESDWVIVYVASDADDKTSYPLGNFPNNVLEKIECASSRNIFEWFFNYAIKANPDNFYFLSNLDINTKIFVSSFDIENTHLQKLFSITIDHKPNFLHHVFNLCKKETAKVSVMAGVFPFMLLNQRKLTIEAVLMPSLITVL